jgi:hypothetical protein
VHTIPTSSRRTQLTYLLGLSGLAGFVACVALEHMLEPALDPLEHQISEYVHTPSGPVMIAGFLLWAASLGASAVFAWSAWRSRSLAASLALGSLGLVLSACFATQTSAGALPPGETLSTEGELHNLGSGLASLALLFGATVSAATAKAPRWFQFAAGLLIAVALVGSVALLAIGPSVGGLRQRLVVAAGCLWQLLLLRTLRASEDPVS